MNLAVETPSPRTWGVSPRQYRHCGLQAPPAAKRWPISARADGSARLLARHAPRRTSQLPTSRLTSEGRTLVRARRAMAHHLSLRHGVVPAAAAPDRPSRRAVTGAGPASTGGDAGPCSHRRTRSPIAPDPSRSVQRAEVRRLMACSGNHSQPPADLSRAGCQFFDHGQCCPIMRSRWWGGCRRAVPSPEAGVPR